MADPLSNLKSFFTKNSKKIQKNFRFDVEFLGMPFGKSNEKNVNSYLAPWHVLKISFPISYGWKTEIYKIGPYPYGFPVMDHSGFDIDVTFEEDDRGTIAYMIYKLQQAIIPMNDGNYAPQSSNRIETIKVTVYDDFGDTFKIVEFNKCFFVKASDLNLDYEGSESLKYQVTFHSDFMNIKYEKAK